MTVMDYDLLLPQKEESILGLTYTQGKIIDVMDEGAIALLCEATLLATKEGKSTVGGFVNSPALLPFHLSTVTPAILVNYNPRLNLTAYSSCDEYIFIGS